MSDDAIGRGQKIPAATAAVLEKSARYWAVYGAMVARLVVDRVLVGMDMDDELMRAIVGDSHDIAAWSEEVQP